MQYDTDAEPTAGVCRHCVLPWEPLSGFVDAQIGEEWHPAHIVAAEYPQLKVKIAFDNGEGGYDEQQHQIESSRMRRVQPSLLVPHNEIDHEHYSNMSYITGQPVWSRWYNKDGTLDEKWYAATIVAYEREYNTYIVVYVDGDEGFGIPPKDIRDLSYKTG